jgi:hypothetical protein
MVKIKHVEQMQYNPLAIFSLIMLFIACTIGIGLMLIGIFTISATYSGNDDILPIFPYFLFAIPLAFFPTFIIFPFEDLKVKKIIHVVEDGK